LTDNEKLTYTIRETADLLGISKNLCYRLAKEGKLPGTIKLGKRMVVSRSQLENLLRGETQIKEVVI
jgi:excisionase family DNA binding protein